MSIYPLKGSVERTDKGEVGLGAVAPGGEVAELVIERLEAVDVQVSGGCKLVAAAAHEHEENERDEEEGGHRAAGLTGDIVGGGPVLEVAGRIV